MSETCPHCGESEHMTGEVEVMLATDPLNNQIDLECQYCLFRCSKGHWQSLPRTRWVSVDERLPTRNVIVSVRGFVTSKKPDPKERSAPMLAAAEHSERWGWIAYHKYQGLRFVVTHWLDGIPDAPEEAKQ